MPSPPEPALPSLPDPAHLLRTVLDVSQTGMLLLRPVLAATGELVDFSYEYLNPAARQQLHHGPQAAATLLAQYPPARTNGVFAFYRQATSAASRPSSAQRSRMPMWTPTTSYRPSVAASCW